MASSKSQRDVPSGTDRFQHPDQAARALRRAVMMVNDIHGDGAGADLLAPLLQELARTARRRGLDVPALVAAALAEPEPAAEPDRAPDVVCELEPGGADPQARRLNARLFHALTQACIEMLALSRSEMEPGAISEELYQLMLGAGIYEELSAGPRDPDRHLTVSLPRDAVLGQMYLLASRRQHAEEFHQREHSELRDHLEQDLVRITEQLCAAGCDADLDLPMGFGIVLWTPDEQQIADGMHGLCFTFGRSAADGRAADFVVRFDADQRQAAKRAADTLYKAHLVQRRRPREEHIDLAGVLFESHPLHRGEVAEAFAGSPIDPRTLRDVAPRFATLTWADRATARVQRTRFIPVGEAAMPAGIGSATRH